LVDQAEGFGAVLDVVIEGRVEGAERFRRNQREDRSSEQRQVFRAVGLAADTAVFPPAGGVAAPVVFVFHRPVLAANLRQPGMRDPAFLNAEDEVAGFLFCLAAALRLVVAGEACQLPRSGKKGVVEVEGGDPQLAVFDAAVAGLGGGGPSGGKRVELLLREGVEGGLVVLEGEIEVGPGAGDGQRGFFWQLRASPVMTALTRTGAACLRSIWLTGSSQSLFSPL
jgi:hypothetical protein